jgi:hypothetical protein
MFEVYCPNHQSHVLLTISRIEAFRNTPEGPELLWRCWCGTRGGLRSAWRSTAVAEPTAA